MISFTSSVYLGLRHASESLRPWARFTTGVPDALATAPEAGAVARSLARLLGAQEATLSRSTLHAFLDLGKMFSHARFYLDAGGYPIARWGIDAARPVVREFAHHDPAALVHALARDAGRPGIPVVVADGYCPGCGDAAPVRSYVEASRRAGGITLLDDTQAVGVVGARPGPDAPYGRGGGGSLPHHGLSPEDVLVVASLAKGFGVPMTVVAGDGSLVRYFLARSETRLHCSPPPMSDLRAAEHAVAENLRIGESLRRRLAVLVRRFRRGLLRLGIGTIGGEFPVQGIGPVPSVPPSVLHRRMESLGVRAVLHAPGCGDNPRVSLLITAAHEPASIDEALGVIARATRGASRVGLR